MRPDYSFWAHGGPRGFSADLWYIDFLERELGEQGYDLITDHDLSEYGAPLLKRYRVLLSGSHPEYPTYKYAEFLRFLLGSWWPLHVSGRQRILLGHCT